MGINYYQQKDQIAVLIQGKMSEVRPTNKGDFYDTIMVLLNGSGAT